MFRNQSRYLVRSILASHRVLPSTHTAVSPILNQSIKFYSSKDNAADKSQGKDQSKSILNDDMLARAGFEDVEPKEETMVKKNNLRNKQDVRERELKLLKTCNVKNTPTCFICLLYYLV